MDALELAHRRVDKAEEKLLAALDGDHPERSLRASLFILSHNDVAWSAAGVVIGAATAMTLLRLQLRRRW